MPDLEERVAALEAAMAMLTRALLKRGDITINDARATHGLPPFPEPWADAAQSEPDFMTRTKTEPLENPGVLTVRLTHEPTGITVHARDRAEGVHKLGKALAGRARREFDLQEAERRRQRKEAEETPGAARPPRRGDNCPDHGTPLLWLGDGYLMCQHGHNYRLPDPPPATTPSRRNTRRT